ncbi:PREDICTED: zinc finger and BTB domain-containing protein 3 [Habropoda laboriosa]|uniref:zinc finger and BTB domain-containing protein 3 n=1 Tax=Habropoda laboriosa TaxID=597456 RepID=UPI00083DA136|nr:PREDICTED: zinc finger and BTB domain-containing protein 3 [Habropoda laboriosa]
MYAPVGEGHGNQQSSLINPWWLHPPAGRTVGHERDQEGKYLLEGGRDRGGEGHGVGPRGGIMDSHQHQFCLKWNSFGSNLATAFSNLFKSESLTDVTLFCEGVTFKAHRLILAACSKHFQELFEGMPPSPAGLIVILDGTSAHNMASLLEFMYRGEVHVSQESLSSFLKAAECLQVKGLSIEHEKLAVAQRHAAENNNSSTDAGGGGGSGGGGGGGSGGSSNGAGESGSGASGNVGGSVSGSVGGGGISGVGGGVGEVSDLSEAGEATMVRNTMKRTHTPSPVSAYPVPSLYTTTSHYYENPPKRLMRSPSDVDTLGRASVLRDGTAFRPASAPHPLLMENHFYQPFIHPSETPAHPHTAPHTPTELEQELERARSEERDLKESVAEDLRIKQEPVALTDRERAEKLAERLSGEVYSGGRGFDGGHYGPNSDHVHHGGQMGHAMVPLPPAHPPTPDLSPAPTTPAMWNTKINKAGTVSTPDGKKLKCPFCERLYGYETNLRAHIRQRHQGIRVPCPFCSRTFTRNNTVRRHIAREHKTELNMKAFQQSNHSMSDTVPQ